MIARSTGRLRPIARGSTSIWMTLASGAIIAPCLVVQWLTDAPTTSTTSACGSSSCGERAGEAARDPERVGETGEQAVGGRGGREDRADQLRRGARARRRASASTAPRPAMIAGRFACREQLGGRRDRLRGRLGRRQRRRRRAAWRLGLRRRLRLDVDRQHQHDRPALDDRALVGALRRRRRRSSRCGRGRRSRRPTRPGRAGRSGSSRSAPPPASRRRARAAGCGSWPPRPARSSCWSARVPGGR